MPKKIRRSSQRLIQVQQGLSIVEVMAAATILALIAVGTASFVPGAFRANQDSRDLTASTQVMNGAMEALSTLDFADVTPYPFATEPVYTPGNPVALIDTTGLNASSPVTVCLERATGNPTQCATGKTMTFPHEVNLNKTKYRVDLIVYKGKHAYLANLPEPVLERFAMASLPEFFLSKGLLSLTELMVPPAEAAPAPASCAKVSGPASVEAGAPAIYTASNSYNPQDSIRWTFQDSPATQITVAAAPFTATKTWTTPGTYSVNVDAFKAPSNSVACTGSPFSVTVTTPTPINFAVTPGLASFVGVSFGFSVNSTLCPSCNSGNTTWDMPGCTPSVGTGLSASCSYAAPGTYSVVNKRNGVNSGSKTITVNSSTVAITSPSTTTHSAGQSVSFAATCGSCGSNPIYEWDFGDGQTAPGQTATHTYPNLGPYTAQVTVRDGSITPVSPQIAQATLPLTIISGTGASLSVSPSSGVAGPDINPSTTNFSFQSSSTGLSGAPNNTNNDPVTYSIWYGDGNTTSDAADETLSDATPEDSGFPVFSHKYANCGNYTATLKAQVGSTTLTATQSVNVSAQAQITPSSTSVQAGSSVSFGAGTVGNGGTNVYGWTFNDDNSTANGSNVSHTFSTPGTFTVGLNVTGGCNPSATTQITVLPDSNSIAAGQSDMKKVIVKVAPWSDTPPAQKDYLGSAVFLMADND
ncbi:MAG: PKD domain-containing protein [Candidatus Sericytochromatia bacterium]